MQRARRIVPAEARTDYEPTDLVEPAEQRLHEVVKQVRGDLDGRVDLLHFTEATSRIVEPAETFFNEVFVMTDDQQLRRAGLGLLATVRDLGAGLVSWESLQI